MNTNLTAGKIASYRQNGYLTVENLLDTRELATWRRAIDSHHNQHDPNTYYSSVFVQCVNLWKTHDAVRELVLDANLGQMAAELSGAAGVRLYHDHALIKAHGPTPPTSMSTTPWIPSTRRRAL